MDSFSVWAIGCMCTILRSTIVDVASLKQQQKMEATAVSKTEAIQTRPTMIETCPAPDKVIHLPLGTAMSGAESTVLLKSDEVELIRLVVPAGKAVPPHRASGEITVQCLEGHIAFNHDGCEIELRAGDLLHLCPKEMHSLRGIADSSALVTLLRPRATDAPEVLPSP